MGLMIVDFVLASEVNSREMIYGRPVCQFFTKAGMWGRGLNFLHDLFYYVPDFKKNCCQISFMGLMTVH